MKENKRWVRLGLTSADKCRRWVEELSTWQGCLPQSLQASRQPDRQRRRQRRWVCLPLLNSSARNPSTHQSLNYNSGRGILVIEEWMAWFRWGHIQSHSDSSGCFRNTSIVIRHFVSRRPNFYTVLGQLEISQHPFAFPWSGMYKDHAASESAGGSKDNIFSVTMEPLSLLFQHQPQDMNHTMDHCDLYCPCRLAS